LIIEVIVKLFSNKKDLGSRKFFGAGSTNLRGSHYGV
jgi:hypothetical protein